MSAPLSRHAAREPAAVRIAAPIGVAFTGIACLSVLLGSASAPAATAPLPPAPAAALSLPTVEVAASPPANPCGDAAVIAALDADDDAAVVGAFGGGAEFRTAVAAGSAPCIRLDDAARSWVVVNKQRPLQPAGFAPASLAAIGVRTTTSADQLRPEVAAALDAMADAVRDEGAGELGVNNGYRSFDVQQRTHDAHAGELGADGADAISARPGHSEHQSGLAVDVVACDVRCGHHEQFGDTAQGRWVAGNAWRFGFIVRYEPGTTGTTGYAPEPWHLRFIGADLAAAYHEGGFRTLEEFFALPAAPDYDH